MIELLVERTWDRVRDDLVAEIGEKTYEVWFSRARVMSLRRGVLLIGVPNDFIRTWIAERYGSLLSRLASDVLGASVRVELVVDPELLAALKSQAAEEEAEETGDPGEVKSLESFVVTPGSELAMRALMHVAGRRKPDLNPLVVHGPEGCGKSHLAGGLALACRPLKSYRVSGAEFARRFSWHLKTRKLDELRERVLSSSVLIVEDLHELASKDATQRELSGVIQAFTGKGGQVVIFSRVHPHDVPELAPGLQSILMSGMLVGIEPPAEDEKIAILERVLAFARRRVPRPVIELIARKVGGSVKRLDREIRKIYAFAALTGDPVTEEWLDRHGPELAGPTDPDLKRFESILAAVIDRFKVDRDALLSKRKTKSLSRPRGLVVVMLRDIAGLTFKSIGRLLGERSHTSVYLMHQRFAPVVAADAELAKFVRDVGRRMSSVPRSEHATA
jgi:chromosomal replication initiator protein